MSKKITASTYLHRRSKSPRNPPSAHERLPYLVHVLPETMIQGWVKIDSDSVSSPTVLEGEGGQGSMFTTSSWGQRCVDDNRLPYLHVASSSKISALIDKKLRRQLLLRSCRERFCWKGKVRTCRSCSSGQSPCSNAGVSSPSKRRNINCKIHKESDQPDSEGRFCRNGDLCLLYLALRNASGRGA